MITKFKVSGRTYPTLARASSAAERIYKRTGNVVAITAVDALTLSKGSRVELHPATDAWMQGDRYGEIVKVGRKFYGVKMDRSGRTLHVSPANIGQVVS